MIAYDTNYDPPAPVVDVTVSSVVNRRLHSTLPALLDTGSDITAIPNRLVDVLQLYPIGRLQLEAVDAKNTTVFTYAVQFALGTLSVPRLEVIVTGLDFIVVGRDVLNREHLLLNGPELIFEMRDTPFVDT